LHGWQTRYWCPECWHDWQDTCGQLHDARFEAQCDLGLAYQLLVEIERGEVPMPPTFDPITRAALPELEFSPN